MTKDICQYGRKRINMSQNFGKVLEDLVLAGPLGDDGIGFIPINDNDEIQIKETDLPNPLPILTLRNAVLFPAVILPIAVGREKSITSVREAYAKGGIIGAISQKDQSIEDPEVGDLNTIGTIAKIVKIFEMPDESITILLQGLQRFEIDKFEQTEPYFTAKVTLKQDPIPPAEDTDFVGIVSTVKDVVIRFIKVSPQLPQDSAFAIKNLSGSRFLINFVGAHVEFSEQNDRQNLLECDTLNERGLKLIELINREIQLLEVKNEIQQRVRSEMDQQQREYFLQQQMKTIQSELGDDPIEGEINRLKEKAAAKDWNENIQKVFDKEISKFSKMNPNGGEYSVQLNYLDLITDLPWNEFSEDNLDLIHAQKVLDEDHFGMEEVKERILEYLAVIKLKGDLKSPIICLYGPPGVGKTSLGKSIARATGREYARISLGGLHDESEIRGHRRTYIGAMPGRIIQAINRVKTSNPVIILDEIDKVGQDHKGDPSSALLEVLDPEQNSNFRDNYIDVDYDLSKVMFITTANRIDTIHPALRDRMEMIHISGYVTEEKLEIAKRHLIPRSLEDHGVSKKKVAFEDDAILEIIEKYTRESGVRGLDKQISKIIRRRAKSIALDEKTKKKIDANEVLKILGTPKIIKDVLEPINIIGVTAGLAWTEMGGEILFVEASKSHGKGSFSITGNLGDVMKESATIALEYIKAHGEEFNIPQNTLQENNLHIHVPEGAIPKDGPSAGITMLTSMVSVLSGKKVRCNVAMTGEITLRGKVLPVGGIKEKILAAKRAGATEIVLSALNKKDVDDIKKEYLNGLTFKYLDTVSEVLNFALEK